MADLLAMAEGPKSQEALGQVMSLDLVDQKIFGEFLTKSSVWDFYDMQKGKYILKDNNEKEKLIINYYNEMVKRMLFIFVQALSFQLVYNLRCPLEYLRYYFRQL